MLIQLKEKHILQNIQTGNVQYHSLVYGIPPE